MTTSVIEHDVDALLHGSPYIGYSYAYPHKTAYRDLSPAIGLHTLWCNQRTDALFLYLHIPFCEFRCGFCNLFTVSQPQDQIVTRYLAALRRQASVVRELLGEASFARLALGGGTPTFLSESELEVLFEVATSVMGASSHAIPVGIEASPATISAAKLSLLRAFGVDRISLGVQSFDDSDAGSLGRPQRRDDVETALKAIRNVGFPTLNIDLIYGGQGQSTADFLASVEAALAWEPEELYLYPLYVRPLTGLGKLDRQWDDDRLDSYRAGREMLLSSGYEQISMRMFRRQDAKAVGGPVYCCQEDGMVGLGCGARSYTSELHYADRYAVKPQAITAIVEQYAGRDEASFTEADFGFRLDDDEQRRRYVIVSLLQTAGLSRRDYRARFQRDALDDLPQLGVLEDTGLAVIRDDRMRLTPAGLERSDAIGPWLYSPNVRRRMQEYVWA